MSEHQGRTGHATATHHLGHATCWWHCGQEEPPRPSISQTLSLAPCFRITLAASLSPVCFSVHVWTSPNLPLGRESGRDTNTITAVQAAGDPYIAALYCPPPPSCPRHRPIMAREVPLTQNHCPRLDGSSGQCQEKAGHLPPSWGPSLPSQDVLGAEVELGADVAGPQGDDTVREGRRRRRDIICPERRVGVRRGAAPQAGIAPRRRQAPSSAAQSNLAGAGCGQVPSDWLQIRVCRLPAAPGGRGIP